MSVVDTFSFMTETGHRMHEAEVRLLQMQHNANVHSSTSREEEDEFLDFDPCDPEVQEIDGDEFFDRYFND